MKILSLLILFGLSQAAQALSVRAKIDDVKFTGQIERESVRRSISAKDKEFKKCGIVPGQVELQIIIDQNGQLSSLKSKLSPTGDSATEQCFNEVAKTLFLPNAEGDKPASVTVTFEVGAQEAVSRTAKALPKRDENGNRQQLESEETLQYKLKSACEAYRQLEIANDESKAKDQQLRKLAYDNNARTRMFQFYASQMTGLKNKADAFSEEYKKQSGKTLDRQKDCGL